MTQLVTVVWENDNIFLHLLPKPLQLRDPQVEKLREDPVGSFHRRPGALLIWDLIGRLLFQGCGISVWTEYWQEWIRGLGIVFDIALCLRSLLGSWGEIAADGRTGGGAENEDVGKGSDTDRDHASLALVTESVDEAVKMICSIEGRT
jgi:hypothetical protein